MPQHCLLLIIALTACTRQLSGFEPQAYGWSTPRWASCPKDVPGAEDAECALVEVPLDWERPDAQKITIFVRKFSPVHDVRGQLWAFDGGPGERGDGFTSGWFRDIATELGFELIVPTHRGTAYGTALDCPNADALASCVDELTTKWGASLRHFDTHMAALDIVALAESYQPPDGRPALAFGGSYGTIWLQRVLQIRPDVFTGVYLDSAGTLTMNFARFGEWFERVGDILLGRCSEEPSCAQNFTDSVEAAAARIVENSKGNSGCFQQLGIELADVQRVLSTTLQTNERRALIAPFVAKFDRCDPNDVTALRAALDYRPKIGPRPTSNGLLNLVTTYRELYRERGSHAELEALSATLLFDNGAMMAHASRRPLFPNNFARALDTQGSGFTGPIHIVQGALDPLTPGQLAADIVSFWQSAQMDVTILPWGGHASPRYTQRPGQKSCSELWLAAFLADPQAPFDRTCLDDLLTPDLGLQNALARELATEFFGEAKVW